ncbi:hypothetical protein C8J57DRAFT_1245736 [Mycena rebaudengoi]|nr:hypothetical protein C8J57DRAFT_1245736 [Mycena rebaudengoi]
MHFAPMLAVFVLCLLKVQPATSKAISLDARTPLGGFGYVHGYTDEDVTEEGSPTGTACVVMSNSSLTRRFAVPASIFLTTLTPLGGFGYVHGYTNEDVTEAGSPTDEEMEKRAPLGGFGYVYGYTNEDVTEGSPIAASVEGRAPFGLAA